MRTCTRNILHAGLLLALLAAPACLAASRVFVASYGLDINPCTLLSPCRTFQVALNAVDAGGEVVALDTAGYGTMTINKSVKVVGPKGVHAAIAATSGSAVTVNSATANVELRGLYLNTTGGASHGINATAFATLVVEDCVVSGFTLVGMNLFPVNAGARIFITDTTVRGNTGHGIFLSGAGEATLDRVRVESHTGGTGITVSSPSSVFKASVRDSMLAGNTVGLSVQSGGQAIVISTLATGNTGAGFAAVGTSLTGTANLTLVDSQASDNAGGVSAANFGSTATVTISGVTVTRNVTGISVGAGTEIRTRGDNIVDGNGTNTSISGTLTPITGF